MGIIISRDKSKLSCDRTGCKCESQYVYGENEGQSAVVPAMQKQGWRYNHSNGKSYCPEHAWDGKG